MILGSQVEWRNFNEGICELQLLPPANILLDCPGFRASLRGEKGHP